MIAARGAERRRHLWISALATGAAGQGGQPALRAGDAQGTAARAGSRAAVAQVSARADGAGELSARR